MLFHACSYASFAAVRSRSQSFPNAIRQSGIKRTRLSCKEGRTLLGANALRVSLEILGKTDPDRRNFSNLVRLVLAALVEQRRESGSCNESSHEMSDTCTAGGAQIAPRGGASTTLSG
jgi:hypothetical protein